MPAKKRAKKATPVYRGPNPANTNVSKKKAGAPAAAGRARRSAGGKRRGSYS